MFCWIIVSGKYLFILGLAAMWNRRLASLGLWRELENG